MQYTQGLVSVVSGSQVVTFDEDPDPPNGDGIPLLLTNASAGDVIRIGDSTSYFEIFSVDSDTQITLVNPYPDDVEDLDFEILRDFTPNLDLALPNQGDLRLADILTRNFRLLDATIGGISGGLSITGCFFGKANVTASGRAKKYKVVAPEGVTALEILSIQIIEADKDTATGTTKVRVATAPEGTTGEQFLEATVTSGDVSGEPDTSPTLEIPVGSYFYVYIPTGGGGKHQNTQYIIFARYVV